VIQNAVSVAIAVSVTIEKNRLNAEIAFHITPKTWFGQLKNLSNAAVSSQIGHILNHCRPVICALATACIPPCLCFHSW